MSRILTVLFVAVLLIFGTLVPAVEAQEPDCVPVLNWYGFYYNLVGSEGEGVCHYAHTWQVGDRDHSIHVYVLPDAEYNCIPNSRYQEYRKEWGAGRWILGIMPGTFSLLVETQDSWTTTVFTSRLCDQSVIMIP
jgi:hypothetical protein